MPENDPQDAGLLLRLTEEFVERIRNGDRPEVSEYSKQYPSLAPQINEAFPLIREMELIAAAETDVNVASNSEEPSVSQLGEYRLVREIGRGSMGVVFEAEQSAFDRRVALKVLFANTNFDDSNRHRFKREANAASKLHHSNIVPVFGLGEESGTIFYAMQLIDGFSLRDLLESNKETDTQQPADRPTIETARIGKEIASALAYANSMGVLHRDVKPSNILLDRDGHAWLADFGLAKYSLQADDGLTRSGEAVGTLRYMAPEAISGIYDERSEVYALGLTMYEVELGLPAIDETDHGKIVYRILEGDIAELTSLAPHVSLDLAKIIGKAIRRNPAERYANCQCLADDLARFLQGEPVAARPPSKIEQAIRWVRRNPSVSAMMSVVVIAMGIALLISAFFAAYFKKTQAEMASERNAANKAKEAEVAALAQARKITAEMYRDSGFRALDSGSYGLASLWFSVAAHESLLANDDVAHAIDRKRSAACLSRCPLPIAVIEQEQSPDIARVEVHPNGNFLILHYELQRRSLKCSKAPSIWDIDHQIQLTTPESLGEVTAAQWGGDGTTIVLGNKAGEVFAVPFPFVDSQSKYKALFQVRSEVIRLSLAPNGARIAAGAHREASLFDIKDKQCTVFEFAAPVTRLRFSPDSQTLLAADRQRLKIIGIDRKPGIQNVDFQRIDYDFQTDYQGNLVFWADDAIRWLDSRSGREIRVEQTGEHLYFFRVSQQSNHILYSTGAATFLADNAESRIVGPLNQTAGCFVPQAYTHLPGCRTSAEGREFWTPAENSESVLVGDYGGKHAKSMGMTESKLRRWQLFQGDGFRSIWRNPNKDNELFTVSHSNVVRLWRLPVPPPKSVRIPTSCSLDRGYVSPDDRNVLIRRTFDGAQVFDIRNGAKKSMLLKPAGILQSALWTPDSKSVVTVSDLNNEAVVDVWNWRTGARRIPKQVIPFMPKKVAGWIHHSIAISPDCASALVVTQSPHNAFVFDIKDGTVPPTPVEIEAYRVDYAPQGNIVVITTPKGFSVWNWEKKAIVKTVDSIDDVLVHSCISRDGGRFVAGGRSGRVYVLDTSTFDLDSNFMLHPNWAWAVDQSHDTAGLLLTKCKDEHLRIWRMNKGELVAPPRPNEVATIPCFVGDGSVVASVQSNGVLRFLSAHDGRPVAIDTEFPFTALFHDAGGRYLSRTRDRRTLVVGGSPFVHIINTNNFLDPPESRDKDLRLQSQLVSGRTISQGSSRTLSTKEWLMLWKKSH